MIRARSCATASLGLAVVLMGTAACSSPPEREPDSWPRASSKTSPGAKSNAPAKPPAATAKEQPPAAAAPKPETKAADPAPAKPSPEGFALPEQMKIPQGERDQVLVTVAGEEVRASDLFQYLFVSFNPQTTRAIQQCVLNVLVAKEAARIGARVPEAEIASEQ